MKAPLSRIVLALFLFAAGFACGLLFRGAPRELPGRVAPQSHTDRADAYATPDTEVRGGRRDGSADGDERAVRAVADDDGPRKAKAPADLDVAIEGSDRDRVHEAVAGLTRLDEPLSAEEVDLLASLLVVADDAGIELLAHALVRSGGMAGLEIVMAFASDPERSVEDRRRALESIDNAPPELAAALLPSITRFMESEMPRELQYTAARALGRLMGEQAVDTLLGLLEDGEEVDPVVIFDAIGATGRGADTESLVERLTDDLDERSRLGLLRAIGEISSREGDGAVLVDLLRTAPDASSRGVIAEAIADSAQSMELGSLRQAIELAAGDAGAQESIAKALAQHGSAGLEVLAEASTDPRIDLDERSLAHALHEYQGGDAQPLMFDLMRESGDREAIEALATRIARDGNSESMDELVGMLETGSDPQRMAVAHAMGDAPSDSLDLPRLLDALRVESDPEVSSELARSIAKVHESDGVSLVADILEETPDAERRQALLWGLEESWDRDPAQARELYIGLAALDPAPEVREDAIEILQEQNDPSLVSSLEQLYASEPDPDVRERLLDAIRELEGQP